MSETTHYFTDVDHIWDQRRNLGIATGALIEMPNLNVDETDGLPAVDFVVGDDI